ncbi:MAG: hypothetical protein SPL22_14405 [Treponema sp.]|uniref:hypothetical protein n=1 Tax=Treponema sp. TaxID=166 RepID=UPI002A91589E|nr:hypothetical protein [Treponema sp.]MDY6398901.1 hypothetical protein [Treponema sp.]
MPYAVLEQKLRMVNEQDFEFVSHFLDLVLNNRKNSSKENQKSMQNSDYLAMLDKSFSQLESGDVVVKSMDELRAMENS